MVNKRTIQAYLNAVSKQVFNKPVSKLTRNNLVTLKVNLSVRKPIEQLDDKTFAQLNKAIDEMM